MSNIATDAAWRRSGLARAITRALLADAQERGIGRIELHATPDGIGLYRSLGFVERGGKPEMRWAGLGAARPGERASGT